MREPLASDLIEAEAMVSAVRRARDSRPALVDAVHHEMRYFPYRRALRDLVRSGYLGELRYVLASSVVDFGVNPAMEPYWFTWVARRDQGRVPRRVAVARDRPPTIRPRRPRGDPRLGEHRRRKETGSRVGLPRR